MSLTHEFEYESYDEFEYEPEHESEYESEINLNMNLNMIMKMNLKYVSEHVLDNNRTPECERDSEHEYECAS